MRDWEAGATSEALTAHARSAALIQDIISAYPKWTGANSLRIANAHRWAWAALAAGEASTAKRIIEQALAALDTKKMLRTLADEAEDYEGCGTLHMDAARLNVGVALAHMDTAARLLRNAITVNRASSTGWAAHSAVLFERGDDRGTLVLSDALES
ncbi:MAG: hypothetical protein ABIV28_05340 [Longimicrobiales bacterium]